MSFFIVVNNVKSKFAKTLQSALRAKVVDKVYRVDHTWLTRQPRNSKVFGITPTPLNKIEQLNAFTSNNITCPKYSTGIDAVGELGKRVFARTLINSTNGRGIVEFEPGIGVTPQAPLYTEYIPKKAEYRVHVFDGAVIDIQQKKKRITFNPNSRNTRIRNLDNGYVYTREGISPPDNLNELAINAVNAVDYRYGAVDIIYNEKRNLCYVLEVNSRPGLQGTTLDKYVDAIINVYNLTRK